MKGPEHSLIPIDFLELVLAFLAILLVCEFVERIGSKLPRPRVARRRRLQGYGPKS